MVRNDERRAELADAGLAVLARDGARGLTHRAVDVEAGAPAGTASNYFRSRPALIAGLFARIGERLAPDPAVLGTLSAQQRDEVERRIRDLDVRSVRLLTNNPDKTASLEDYGVPVKARVPLTPHPNDHNLAYLLTKRDRMGHDLPDREGSTEMNGSAPMTGGAL